MESNNNYVIMITIDWHRVAFIALHLVAVILKTFLRID